MFPLGRVGRKIITRSGAFPFKKSHRGGPGRNITIFFGLLFPFFVMSNFVSLNLDAPCRDKYGEGHCKRNVKSLGKCINDYAYKMCRKTCGFCSMFFSNYITYDKFRCEMISVKKCQIKNFPHRKILPILISPKFFHRNIWL